MAHDRMAPVSTATTRSSPPTRNFFPSSNSSHSISASTASVIRSSSSSSLATQSSQTIVSNSTRQRDRERKDLGDERAATSSSTVSTTSSIDKPFTVKPTARRARRSTQSSQDGVSSTTQRKPEQMETNVGFTSYSSVKEVPLTILESPLASSETNYLSSSSGGPGSDKEEASASSAALNLAHQQHLRMKPSRMVVKRRATVPAPTTSTVTSTVPPPPPNTTPTTTTRRNGRPGPSPPKHLERWQLRLRRSISGNSSSTDEEHGFSTHDQPSRRFETSSRRRQLQSPPSPHSSPQSSSSSSSLNVTSPRTAARQVVAPKSPFETTQKLARPVRIRYETPERGRGGKVEISHASLGKLIARLTDAHQYDTEFRDVFLLTFPCFCSPYDFIKKLLKRYTAVLSLCATVDEQTLDEMQRRLDEIMAQEEEEEEEDEERTEDDEKTGHPQHRASIITSISTARSDINTNMEANVSIMRLLSVLKFWIKESGFIEHDVAWDRKTAKKLLSFLTEIHQTAPIPSIRTHAETLLVYVTQVVKKQRKHALGGHGKAPIGASAPVLHQLSDRGASHSRLRSQAATKLALARSSSDPKQKHDKKVGHNSPPRVDLVVTPGVLLATRAPKIARGITTGSADAFGLDDVMQETLQRARVTAASRKSARSGYESVDPLAGFSAPDLADQLTLIEVEQYFIPLDPRELTNKAWTREATKHVDAPHVMALIELFDATAEWVSSEILHPQLQAVERAKMITLFIDAAHHCYQLNNFNTLFELLTGLSAPCIRQLNTTWSLVSATAQEKYQCLTQLCAPDDNYRNYRQAFALAEGQPRLACWFLLVKDLFTYEEAMKSVEEGLVNWQKFRKIYRVISEALDRQNFNYVAAGNGGNGPNGGLNSGRKGRGGMLRHDRKTQQLLRHRVDTIRKDSTVLYQLARNANTQESILFVNSLSEAGFL